MKNVKIKYFKCFEIRSNVTQPSMTQMLKTVGTISHLLRESKNLKSNKRSRRNQIQFTECGMWVLNQHCWCEILTVGYMNSVETEIPTICAILFILFTEIAFLSHYYYLDDMLEKSPNTNYLMEFISLAIILLDSNYHIIDVEKCLKQ